KLRSAFDPGETVALGPLEAFSGRGAAEPWRFAATRPVPPSAAPCLVGERLAPAPVVLRVFLVRDPGGTWHAMPGGLAHVLSDVAEEGIAGPPASRGAAKDVWVMAEDSTDIVGPPPPRAASLPIRRSSGELPSRVADELYWLGRYLERLEAAARLTRALLMRLLRGAALPREFAEMRALARCLHAAGLLDAQSAASPPDGGLLPRAIVAAA
ncbi:alpha-E domain-containing protein, partial [Falsiroseomonas oryzae]|uniref:alpha-E domain-containing protein n=1 Tax=Falsiroseomonas oryzae TaxID=2766473 RepID=UPI0022EB8D2D